MARCASSPILPSARKARRSIPGTSQGPKGDPGLACWDLNGDGIQDATEDINLDGLWDAADCKGPQGEPGAAGTNGTNELLACWDLNGDGIQDAAEDINLDGLWDAADCKGPQGDGAAGTAGTDGTNGTNGTNGLACWDLNGNGVADSEEDVNADAVVDALDCKGPKGDAGDTANVDALQAEVAALHDQVDYVYSLHSNTVFLSSAMYDRTRWAVWMVRMPSARRSPPPLAFPGTFRAWLSDSTGSPSTRFTQSTLRYVRVDGVKVADDWADLTDITMTAGFLYTPINVTENGDQLSEASPFTWTTTRTDGTAISQLSFAAVLTGLLIPAAAPTPLSVTIRGSTTIGQPPGPT